MIGRILIVLCLSLSGCSGSPIAPTGTAGFPDIAGTYSGTLTRPSREHQVTRRCAARRRSLSR